MLTAQISIVSSDMAVIGETIPRQQDTLPTVNEGNSGANQTWDFSGVASHVLVNTSILAPSSTPYAADFPSANLVMTNDNLGFIYFSIDVNNLITNGAAGDLLGTGEIIKAPFNPDLLLNQYSTDYGDNFIDTYSFDVTADGSSFSTLIDSIRLKHDGIVYDTVDGWGTTIIPTGSYNSLRIKRVEDAIDSIWTKAPDLGFPFPPPDWVFFDAITDTNTTYTWLAKEGKLAIAELNFDSLDNPNVLTWTLIPAIPVANFSYTDNGSGGYTFTDQSSNTPTTWLWDFGDGNTSTSQNPANQYTADGTYFVCLTITNASGSDMLCDSVVVTGATVNPPPVANFSYTDNGTGLLDFTDLSSNPPFISWSWTFGDGNTSAAQNPMNQYASNGTYTVCVTVTNANGNDMFCDIVTITGIGGGPVAPVALFSWMDGGGALIDFTDQTSNTPTSWAWDFGDGFTSTAQSPVHQYSATATKYNACLTATNGAGSDTYCDSVISPDSIITPGIEKMDLGSSVHVYPNPTLDYVQIEMEDGGGGQFVFSLYNALGQRVLREAAGISAGQIWNIGLEQMPQGSYFYLLLNQATGAQSSGKLEIR